MNYLEGVTFMSHPLDTTNTAPSGSTLLEKSKARLMAFFQQPSVKKLVPVLVPSALAAALLPAFGPAVAGAVAVIAVKSGLDLLGISFSDDTIKKLAKPLEGQQLDESDMQDILQETLEKLIPEDKQVNEETAKALIAVTPAIKEAALTNPKLDVLWLGASLETNLKQQGEVMARVSSDVRDLMQKEGVEFEAKRQRLLREWPQIVVEVTSTNESKVSNIESKAKAAGGAIGHRIAADNKSTIEGVKVDSERQ
jgi:hypothetical protein